MAIKDITQYTWIGNDTIDVSQNYDFDIQGTSYSPLGTETSTTRFTITDEYTVNGGLYLLPSDSPWYRGGIGWTNANMKILRNIRGIDTTNQTLITWMQTHGTLIAPQYLSRKLLKINSGIASQLNGKYCNKVNIDYVQCGKVPETTGETWIIHEVPDTASLYEKRYPIIFSNMGLDFVAIGNREEIGTVQYYWDEDNVMTAYESDYGWGDDEYRILYFPIPPTGELRTWLQANADKQ